MHIKSIPGHEGHIVTEFMLQQSDVIVDTHPVDYGNFEPKYKTDTARAWVTVRLTDTARGYLREFVHGDDVDWNDDQGAVYHRRFVSLKYVYDFPSSTISWKGVKKVNQHLKWKAACIEANHSMETDDPIMVLDAYRLHLQEKVIDPSNKKQADYFHYLADMDRIDWDSTDEEHTVLITRAITATKDALAVLTEAKKIYRQARVEENAVKRICILDEIKNTDDPAVKYYAHDIIKQIEADQAIGKITTHSFDLG